MTKKLWTTLFVLLWMNYAMQAQDSCMVISLKEAQTYALENNANVKNAQLDLKIAEKQIWETTGIGLPQVSASVNYQNMLDIPTQFMPDFISPSVIGINQGLFGLTPIAPLPESEPMPVQFGSQHNADWGVTVSQLVFSGEYIVGLQASRIFKRLSEQSLEKTEQETRESIAQSYYLVLVAEESYRIIDSTYQTILTIASDNEAMLKAGFIDQTDVDQMKLNVNNLKSSKEALSYQVEIAYRLLKFQMGLSFEQDIKLTDELAAFLEDLDFESLMVQNADITNHINYKLTETQEQISLLTLKREKSTVLPTLAAFASYSKSAMRDEFDFMDSDKGWYPTTVVGLKLDIPIFGGGMRYARIKQKQFAYEKAMNSKVQVSQALMTEYLQAKSGFVTAYNSYMNQKNSLELSEKIYSRTLIKYKQGVAGSFDLSNAQNQVLSAQSSYFNAVVELLNAKVKLDKFTK